jgi:hypothetical protein
MPRDILDASMGLLERGSNVAAVFGSPAAWATALSALAALWLCLSTLLIALRLTRWLVPGMGLALRWSSTFGTGMWLATLGFHVLRGCGLFTLPAALIGCTCLLGAVQYAAPGGMPWVWLVRRELRAVSALGRLFARAQCRLLLGLLACAAALLTLRSLLIPALGWDAFTYHAARAALWVQSGPMTFDRGPGPYDMYRLFFAGAEVLMAWAMLPFHSDLFANLALIAQWFGLGLASWALGRALGLREPNAWIGAVVVMFVPTVQFELGSGYVELALNAALIQAAALAVHCLRRFSSGACVVAALALGVAIGIKLPGAPPAAIIAGTLALRVLLVRGFNWRSRLRCLAASSVCMLLPVTPWLWLAWRETGYPLSPFPVSVLGCKLGSAAAALTWHQAELAVTPYTWPTEYAALRVLFSPLSHFNESFGALALIPLGVFPLGWFVLAKRRPATALSLLVTAALPVLVHFSRDMSAVRLIAPASVARYMITSLAIVVPISLMVCTSKVPLARGYRWLLLLYPLTYILAGFRYGWGAWENREIVVAAACVLLAAAMLRAVPRARARCALAIVLGMLASMALQARRDHTRPQAFADSFALHESPRYWTAALPFVDVPNKKQSVAITGGPFRRADRWFQYFALGARFQNRLHYVPLSRDGSILQFGPDADFAVRADQASWRKRLRDAGISFVMTFAPRSLEQQWMDAAPHAFERLAGDHEWGLYRVKP